MSYIVLKIFPCSVWCARVRYLDYTSKTFLGHRILIFEELFHRIKGHSKFALGERAEGPFLCHLKNYETFPLFGTLDPYVSEHDMSQEHKTDCARINTVGCYEILLI